MMARHLIKATWPEKSLTPAQATSDSWQSYVDQLLIGKGNVAEALICSADTGTVLGSTTNFEVSAFHVNRIFE
jgi:hypothetical protein